MRAIISKLFARLQLQILLLATAKGFGRKGKCILFSGDALKAYAKFSKACMQTETDRKKLYRVAYRLGRKIRLITGFTDQEDLARLVYFLYRNIGITMSGELPGVICVSECYFSKIYSERECRCISAMDAGIIAGICGNGKLYFTERITGGCNHCTAVFEVKNHE